MCLDTACIRSVKKRGMCETHYRRWRIHGDFTVTKKRANGDGFNAHGYTGYQIGGVKKFEHVRVMEEFLGHPLPPDAVIHHINEIKSDNRIENLLLCKDRAHHNLIHARMRAKKACGNPDWRPCRVCRNYDALENLRVYPRGKTTPYWHRECLNKQAREKRGKNQ